MPVLMYSTKINIKDKLFKLKYLKTIDLIYILYGNY